MLIMELQHLMTARKQPKDATVSATQWRKWGLTVYVGRGDKKSKTEAMFIPSTNKIKEWRQKKD